MEKKTSAYSKLLVTAFTENELASLEKQPHFNTALAAVRSFGEFERMCAIGHRMLAKDSRRSTSPPELQSRIGSQVEIAR